MQCVFTLPFEESETSKKRSPWFSLCRFRELTEMMDDNLISWTLALIILLFVLKWFEPWPKTWPNSRFFSVFVTSCVSSGRFGPLLRRISRQPLPWSDRLHRFLTQGAQLSLGQTLKNRTPQYCQQKNPRIKSAVLTAPLTRHYVKYLKYSCIYK